MPSLSDIQTRLAAMGYSPGASDNLWGKKTADAIMAALNDLSAVNAVASKPKKAAPRRYVSYLRPEWLPLCKMDRVHIHWSAGAYVASELDKEHYHFLIEGDLDVLRGDHSVTGNVPPLREGGYAAHTLGANSHAIGVALCAMAGAVEHPFNAGRFPVTAGQWDRLCHVVAQLCDEYAIAVTDKTVLTHAEVQPNLGVKQRGKWDITRLAFAPEIVGAKACGDKLRRDVAALL